jgi:molybdopterin-guanine dinucleotide biosynthesis protein A
VATADRPASLAGVVLAGGASLRDGRDKALKPMPSGQPGARSTTTMVEHVVSILGQRCDPVLVVAAPGQSLPELPARVVRDDARGTGPLLAIARGLHEAADAGAKWAFLCAVDVPFLTTDVIDTVVARAAEIDADIVLPWDGDNHYLAAVYRTDVAARVDELVAAGERNLPALINRVDSQRVVISDAGLKAAAKAPSGLRSLLHIGR